MIKRGLSNKYLIMYLISWHVLTRTVEKMFPSPLIILNSEISVIES